MTTKPDRGQVETATGDFEPEQKRYLEGFVAGLQIAKTAKGVAGAAAPAPLRPSRSARMRPRVKAQDRVLAAGGKLSDPGEVQARRESVRYLRAAEGSRLAQRISQAAGQFPLALSSACSTWRRTRTPICAGCAFRTASSKAAQFAGLADLAERYGGGYAHVTTRANLQIREIEAKNAVAMIEAVQDLGLCSRGSGADNIRNVTGTPPPASTRRS